MASTFKRKTDRPGARWSIAYTDEAGRRRTKRAYRDKRASETLARKLEDEAKAIRDGLIDVGAERRAEAARAPIEGHIDDYRRALEGRGDTPAYIAETTRAIEDAIKSCAIGTLADFDAQAIGEHLRALRTRPKRPIGARAHNKRLRAVKSFAGWLVKQGRATANPLASLAPINERTDRRHERRALEPGEARRLIRAAERGPIRGGVSGADRAVAYSLMLATGLRRGELNSLTPRSFDLDGEQPSLTILAAYSKHRRRDVQPVPAWIIPTLRTFITGKAATARLWSIPHKSAAMLRADLSDAGIDYRDDAGRVLDMHSLRHSFITEVVESNAPVRTAMELARHSTSRLTLDYYSHARLVNVRGAVEGLSDLSTHEEPAIGEMRATGTDDSAARAALSAALTAPRGSFECNGNHLGGALDTTDGTRPSPREDARCALKNPAVQQGSTNEAEGTRTPNHRIDSPVL